MTSSVVGAGAVAKRTGTRAGLPLGTRESSSSGGRPRLAALWPQALAILAALGIWWWGSLVAPRGSVPSPWATLVALGEGVVTAEFWAAVGETMATFAAALAFCIVVGVPLGLAIGLSKFATASTRLLFDFLRTIPPIALLPLVLLTLGATSQMVFVLTVAGGLWPVLIQSVYAARQVEPQLVDMARAFRIRGWWQVGRIFVPSVLPFVLTGLRVSTTICLLLTISGELLGSAPGLGKLMAAAMGNVNNPDLYAAVLVSGILGVLVNTIFWRIQRRMLHWHPSFRAEVH